MVASQREEAGTSNNLLISQSFHHGSLSPGTSLVSFFFSARRGQVIGESPSHDPFLVAFFYSALEIIAVIGRRVGFL